MYKTRTLMVHKPEALLQTHEDNNRRPVSYSRKLQAIKPNINLRCSRSKLVSIPSYLQRCSLNRLV